MVNERQETVDSGNWFALLMYEMRVIDRMMTMDILISGPVIVE